MCFSSSCSSSLFPLFLYCSSSRKSFPLSGGPDAHVPPFEETLLLGQDAAEGAVNSSSSATAGAKFFRTAQRGREEACFAHRVPTVFSLPCLFLFWGFVGTSRQQRRVCRAHAWRGVALAPSFTSFFGSVALSTLASVSMRPVTYALRSFLLSMKAKFSITMYITLGVEEGSTLVAAVPRGRSRPVLHFLFCFVHFGGENVCFSPKFVSCP